MDDSLKTVESLLKLRINANDTEHAEAVRRCKWSQVAGLHGIGTGLLMALMIVRVEIRAAQGVSDGRRDPQL